MRGRPRIFRTFAIATVLAVNSVSVAFAGEICAQLEFAMGVATQISPDAVRLEQIRDALDADDCLVSRDEAGATSVHCLWGFPLRSDRATERFGELDQAIATCRGEVARIDEAQGVNHPDTYSQRLYRAGDIRISLALKDKGALQRSFVFLGLSCIPKE